MLIYNFYNKIIKNIHNQIKYFLGSCKTVLMTSNGWKITVEKSPEAIPAKVDFNIGCYKID